MAVSSWPIFRVSARDSRPLRHSTTTAMPAESRNRLPCSPSSRAACSVSYSYAYTAPMIWFWYSTGEAARLRKAPSR